MNKIFSIVTAMTTLCSSIPAIASAEEEKIDYGVFDTSYYREYNGVDIFTNDNPYNRYDKAYIKSDNSGFMLLKKINNIISFTPADGVDYKEVSAALSGHLTQEGFAYISSIDNDYGKKDDGTKYSIKAATGITEADAKEVCAVLKDSGIVKELIFHNDRYMTVELFFRGWTSESKGNMTSYLDNWQTEKNERDIVKEYFENNNIQNYTVEDVYYDGYDCNETLFIPDESVTFEEQLVLVQDIAEKLGIIPELFSYDYGYTSIADTYEINLFDYVEGDANIDSTLNLADSVAILQSIANPDQYELTPQGKFNADIDGNGLTTGDALEIQKQLLNVK